MRRFIDLCFARPIAVSALLALLGALAVTSWVRIPVALLPDLRYPAMVVWTAYPDVPPERVERAVTVYIEEAVASVSGLQRITSRSRLGGSLVRIDLDWNTSLDLALLEIREQLDRLGSTLPAEASRPVVLRIDPSDRPMMVLSFRPQFVDSSTSSNTADLTGLKRVAEDVIARRLEQLDGVSRVRVTGGFDRQVDVILDPARLTTFGVSADEVASALRQANVQLPGGFIRRGPFRYVVEVSGEFRHTQDIADAVIAHRGIVPIRTRNLAEVRESTVERRGLVRLDGTETLLLFVERRPDANTIATAADVRAALRNLRGELPNVELGVLIDDSEFIRESVDSVVQAVLVGGLLAILILLGFLRRARPLIAVAVAIPVSLGIAVALFGVFGVSFNLISLSGLALGVGMLVDNAIVVVENIERLRQSGLPMMAAGRRGASEVAGAITASTLTTVAVFLPITFLEGLAGRLFRDQSLAVVSALAASLLVSLAVVPLVATYRRPTASDGSASHTVVKKKPSRILAGYERMLVGCLSHRFAVVICAVIVCAGATAASLRIPREVVPETDQGRVLLDLATSPDADLSIVSALALEFEQRAAALPDVAHVLADLGQRDGVRLELEPRPPYESEVTLVLRPGHSSKQVAATLKDQLRVAPAGEMSAEVRMAQTQLEDLLSRGRGELMVDLLADDRRDAEVVVEALVRRLRGEPALSNVHRFDRARIPAYRIDFKRDEMARHGVTTSELEVLLESIGRGVRATHLRTVNEAIPIVLRAQHLGSVEALLDEQIGTKSGSLPLRSFVEVARVDLPSDLLRADQAPVVRVVADIAPEADLLRAGEAVYSSFDDILPSTVRGILRGATDAFTEGLHALFSSLMLSVLLVYLILAAQFESLVQPLIVLLSVPLAVAGVVVALLVTGQSINLMSLTGCVVLVGIVVNDAIIKVDFINQRRAAGLPVRDAIVEAGRDRVRPIVMTTATTVLGLLPLALGFGSGAELRAPLAIALVGGIVGATALTLFVVPVCYSLTESTRA